MVGIGKTALSVQLAREMGVGRVDEWEHVGGWMMPAPPPPHPSYLPAYPSPPTTTHPHPLAIAPQRPAGPKTLLADTNSGALAGQQGARFADDPRGAGWGGCCTTLRQGRCPGAIG